jgi:hypothetical protein
MHADSVIILECNQIHHSNANLSGNQLKLEVSVSNTCRTWNVSGSYMSQHSLQLLLLLSYATAVIHIVTYSLSHILESN